MINKTLDSSSPTVIVDNLTVEYRVETTNPERHAASSFAERAKAKLLGRSAKVSVFPIQNLNLVAHRGESIGLIGKNGAGKSTLLRLIAGAEPPKSGNVYSSSNPVLLGVSAAMVPQLSGYENVTLGLLAMGVHPNDVKKYIKDIIRFSEIGSAIHRPMRTYSSGMGARLKFAIATAVKPEILLVDEALSTGDATFQEKSRQRMNGVLDNAGTVFIVSHSTGVIKQMANRVVWLHNGVIVADGEPEPILEDYKRWSRYKAAGEKEKAAIVVRQHRDSYVEPEFVRRT